MTALNIKHLINISYPVMDQFHCFEPKAWDHKAILVELVGEVGSLAHYLQRWDKFKKGSCSKALLGDECSDVLFIVLRLARHAEIELPDQIDIPPLIDAIRGSDLVLEMCNCICELHKPFSCSREKKPFQHIIELLGQVAEMTGIDLLTSFELEMQIAEGFFRASRERWPKPQYLRHPFESLRLWRLLKKRKRLD